MPLGPWVPCPCALGTLGPWAPLHLWTSESLDPWTLGGAWERGGKGGGGLGQFIEIQICYLFAVCVQAGFGGWLKGALGALGTCWGLGGLPEEGG